MTWELVNGDWRHVILSAAGGAMVGIVASMMFCINFRLWNKYETDRRIGPQLICFFSYFFNLGIFLLTMYYAIQLWRPWEGSYLDLIAFFLTAAAIFAAAFRIGIIPERRKADAKMK